MHFVARHKAWLPLSLTLKLTQPNSITVSDFSETLSRLYEEHATALQVAVSNYRKKNAELRKER